MATSTSEDITTLKEEVCDEAETSKSTKLESTRTSSKGTQGLLQKFLARSRSYIPYFRRRQPTSTKSCIPPAHPQLHEPVTKKNTQPLDTKDTPSPTTTPQSNNPTTSDNLFGEKGSEESTVQTPTLKNSLPGPPSSVPPQDYDSAISQPVITQAIPNTETPAISQPTTSNESSLILLPEKLAGLIITTSSESSLICAPRRTACTESPPSSPLYMKKYSPQNAKGGAKAVIKSKIKPSLYTIIDSPRSSLTSRSPSPDECITINILIIGGEGCGKTTVKNHLQIPGGLVAEVIDTFGIEYDTFFKETKDKVLGYYRNVHLIVFVLKYEEEPDEEAIQNQFGLFDKFFTQKVHAITVLVITHCERKKNEEVIEEYTQLCPTDRARLGIVPVGFTENPSGPWKGRIIKKMKDDKEILQNLVLKCKDSVPASQIFKE